MRTNSDHCTGPVNQKQELISATSDAAFKRLFKERSILIPFLNSILKEDRVVIAEVKKIAKVVRSAPGSPTKQHATPHKRKRSSTIDDVQYITNECPGFYKSHRTIRYDLVVVTADNTIIDIEMQTQPQTFYLDRMVYYSSRLICNYSGWSGDKQPRNVYKEFNGERISATELGTSKWNYSCNPVYIISIFATLEKKCMSPKEPKQRRGWPRRKQHAGKNDLDFR
ncbi:hypothetical protein PtA15_18A189 [Puccinia triticina]|uniref:PD-(D/E)XK endonuclease-like domain-containing protein n=1 Tax=Puccinia triticina TaxID=208348 RepID=A0ABY7D9V4_9BASI|nr:uncharacterized protein PtA15_18A189 [Puccinia triticina]WAQ93131.1 hypothetical protein PtA15_18A189 [Puccinia triticina]